MSHYFEIIPPKSEEFCRKNVTKHADDSSWNFAKLLDHCNEYLSWRRSSVISNRTKILITAMEICIAGSNKTGPVSEFHNRCLPHLLLPRYFLTLKLQEFTLAGTILVLALEGKEIASSVKWDASFIPGLISR